MLLDLYLSEDDVVETLNNITAPNIKELKIFNMNNQAKLLKRIKWKNFP
jgi:hypothetical protein